MEIFSGGPKDWDGRCSHFSVRGIGVIFSYNAHVQVMRCGEHCDRIVGGQKSADFKFMIAIGKMVWQFVVVICLDFVPCIIYHADLVFS